MKLKNSIGNLRLKVQRRRIKGCFCPVCDQFIKEYRRTITSTMAYSLILLYKRGLEIGKKKWIHVGEYMNSLKNVPHIVHDSPSKLLYWKLVSSKKAKNKYADTPCSGEYRLTKKGAMFVEEKIKVPKHVILFNKEIIEFDKKIHIDIRDALGKKFSYKEIMKPAK